MYGGAFVCSSQVVRRGCPARFERKRANSPETAVARISMEKRSGKAKASRSEFADQCWSVAATNAFLARPIALTNCVVVAGLLQTIALGKDA